MAGAFNCLNKTAFRTIGGKKKDLTTNHFTIFLS